MIDPFAGSATTQVVARRHGRRAGGIELHWEFVEVARERLTADQADDPPGFLRAAV